MNKETLLTFGFVDNEYLDKYLEIVNHNDNDEYTEKHHIIPRSFYEHRDAEVDNSENNLVSLNYKNHILAHYYSCFCTVKKDRQSMTIAFKTMTNFGCKKFNIDMISELERAQELREDAIENMREAMTGENNPFYGKHWSEEHKKKISEANSGENSYWYGKHHSDESKKKNSEAHSGKNHPMYGTHRSEETKEKLRASRYNEDGTSKYSGENSYWYGKHHSEETKEKLREVNTGKHHSEETKEKLRASRYNEDGTSKYSGEKNPMYGKHFSWYTNGVEDIKVVEGQDVPSGYHRGRTKGINKGNKFDWYTNGVVNKKVFEGQEVPEGFYKGYSMKKRV